MVLLNIYIYILIDIYIYIFIYIYIYIYTYIYIQYINIIKTVTQPDNSPYVRKKSHQFQNPDCQLLADLIITVLDLDVATTEEHKSYGLSHSRCRLQQLLQFIIPPINIRIIAARAEHFSYCVISGLRLLLQSLALTARSGLQLLLKNILLGLQHPMAEHKTR
jgi:hypothetical protein